MNNLRRLLPYIAPHRKMILLSFLLTVLSGSMSGGFVFIGERVLKPMFQIGTASPDVLRPQLNFWVGVILCFSAMQMVLGFGQQYVTQRTGQKILFKLREDLFVHFQTLSIAFFEKKRTGEVMSRLTSDVGALQAILTSTVTTVAGGPVALTIYLGYMVYQNWRLSLFVLFILPPVAFLINRGGRKIRAAVGRLQEQNATLSNYLQEKVSAMRLIQTFGTQSIENEAFRVTNQRTYHATMKPIRVQSSLGPTIQFVGMCGVVACLWFGGRDVIDGRMRGEALLGFVFAMNQAASQIKNIANLMVALRSAEAAAGRLWEIMDTRPEILDQPDAIALHKGEVRGHLRFENVRFAYQDGPDVLKGISFEIRPGEVLALAGRSGSGKTTISSLIPRLYDPTGGRITLDGRDLREVQVQSLRELIGAVPQDITLFHGTIRENIAYGCPHATHEQIVEAAKRAHAHEFIEKLENGYDSHIGERGGGFSGGQKQRLAIARALLRDPKLLILDEATSALDPESEGLVQDAFNELMKGRTTLIIAHRFSTIVGADKILVMEAGEILETGTHRELLERGGVYQKMYEKQSMQAKRGDLESDLESEIANEIVA